MPSTAESGVISLNRGDKLNAISGDLKRALVERFPRPTEIPPRASSSSARRAELLAGYDIGPNPAGRRGAATRSPGTNR